MSDKYETDCSVEEICESFNIYDSACFKGSDTSNGERCSGAEKCIILYLQQIEKKIDKLLKNS